jgi:hypothetical protein
MPGTASSAGYSFVVFFRSCTSDISTDTYCDASIDTTGRSTSSVSGAVGVGLYRGKADGGGLIIVDTPMLLQ